MPAGKITPASFGTIDLPVRAILVRRIRTFATGILMECRFLISIKRGETEVLSKEIYYRLKEPWAFRGWQRLPYALRAEAGEKKYDKPLFFNREQFMALLSCNGEEALRPEELR